MAVVSACATSRRRGLAYHPRLATVGPSAKIVRHQQRPLRTELRSGPEDRLVDLPHTLAEREGFRAGLTSQNLTPLAPYPETAHNR